MWQFSSKKIKKTKVNCALSLKNMKLVTWLSVIQNSIFSPGDTANYTLYGDHLKFQNTHHHWHTNHVPSYMILRKSAQLISWAATLKEGFEMFNYDWGQTHPLNFKLDLFLMVTITDVKVFTFSLSPPANIKST